MAISSAHPGGACTWPWAWGAGRALKMVVLTQYWELWVHTLMRGRYDLGFGFKILRYAKRYVFGYDRIQIPKYDFLALKGHAMLCYAMLYYAMHARPGL